MKKKPVLKAVVSPVKKLKKSDILAAGPYPAPRIEEKKRKLVKSADLVEVGDTSLIVSLDLKRQTQEQIEATEIDADQKFFPYAVIAKLVVGWESISFISSFEFKITAEYPLPQIVVRFVEKMSEAEVKEIDPTLRKEIEMQIARVRQYPFIKVESPLLS